MNWGIGCSVPFAFLGPALAFVAWAVVILVIIALRDILTAQKIIW